MAESAAVTGICAAAPPGRKRRNIGSASLVRLTAATEEQARQHHSSPIALQVAQGEPASTGSV